MDAAWSCARPHVVRLFVWLFCLVQIVVAKDGVLQITATLLASNPPRPVPGVRFLVEGQNGASFYTNKDGNTTLSLPDTSKPGLPVTVTLADDPESKKYQIVNPTFPVPSFEDRPEYRAPVSLIDPEDFRSVAVAVTARAAKEPQDARPASGGDNRFAASRSLIEASKHSDSDVEAKIRGIAAGDSSPYARGLAQYWLGDFAAAEQSLGTALAGWKGLLEKDRRNVYLRNEVADAAFYLGQAQYRRHEYKGAAASFDEAVKLYPDIPVYVINLAVSLDQDGQFADGEQRYKDALRLVEKFSGSDSIKAAEIIGDLAGLLSKMSGRYDEAKSLFQQARDIRKAKGAKDDPNMLEAFALLLGDTGGADDFRKAENLMQEALKIRLAMPEEADTTIALTQHNLARILRLKASLGFGKWTRADVQKFYADADTLSQNALHTFQLHDDDPNLPGVMVERAFLLQAMNQKSEALQLAREALRTARMQKTPAPPETIGEIERAIQIIRDSMPSPK